MRFGFFQCPRCKIQAKIWEPEIHELCKNPDCTNIVDGIPTPVEMDLLSYGSVTPKFSITIDV